MFTDTTLFYPLYPTSLVANVILLLLVWVGYTMDLNKIKSFH